MKGLTIGAVIVAAALLVSTGGGLWWLTQRVEGSYFDSEGVRIHFTDEGSGVPLVLVHGFAVNADLNWRLTGLTEALAREFRVISMDLRGHGLSGKPHDPELYGNAMAEDVIALLDHLGIEKAHLAGYSLGGIITLKLATTHPDRLLSASPLGAGWESPEDSTFLVALAGISEALESGHGVPPLSASLGGDREPPGFLHTIWVRVMTGYLNDGRALAAMVRGIRGLTVEREAVGRISVPVCSIVGTLDPMRAGVDAMVGVVPDHTVVFVEGADHLQATRSPELARALLEFLRTHSDGTGCKTDLSSGGKARLEAALPPPNIVVVVVDDLRWDEYGAAGHAYLTTPNIDRLAEEGATFRNAFHVVPLCSPNRASLLTGQYPSRHGIVDNVARNLLSHSLRTFPRALQRVGYETAFIGKWHMGNDPTPRPGFDYWVGLPGQGRTVNPELYEGGRLHEVEGYVTDLLTDRALAFIRKPREAPFLIYLSHKAVHPDARQLDDGSVDRSKPIGYIPAPRHRGVYDDGVFSRRPNVVLSRNHLSGKPALRQALAFRDSDLVMGRFAALIDPGTSEETIRRRAEMLLAVDDSLGRIIATLEEMGVLDETMIVFTSDNGFFYGEHGLSIERRLPYEEAVRNPLLLRYPALAAAGSEIDGLALSIDIAPTSLEVAGAPIGSHIQGQSLVPLLKGNASEWRRSALIEFYAHENPMPWLMDMDYRAVRTERYKYIHWIRHARMDELYDLETDPYEVQNLIDVPQMAGVRKDLRAELERLVLEGLGLGGE